MTVTAVQITKRPAPATATAAQRTPAPQPSSLVIVGDVEQLAVSNSGRCNDSNPYN